MKIRDSATSTYLTDDEVIRAALAILQHRFGLQRKTLNNPGAVLDYLRLSFELTGSALLRSPG